MTDDLLPQNATWLDRFASKYAKTFAALIIGALAWATVVVHSPVAHISGDEWLQAGGTLATALGVYGTTNISSKGA